MHIGANMHIGDREYENRKYATATWRHHQYATATWRRHQYEIHSAAAQSASIGGPAQIGESLREQV